MAELVTATAIATPEAADYMPIRKSAVAGLLKITLAQIRAFCMPTESIIIAIGDETNPILAGAGKVTFRMPYALNLSAVRASLKTAQATSGAGGIVTIDINEAGASILSTLLTIDNTEKTSVSANTPAVISDASLADDAEMTIDLDQIGDGTAVGLKVVLIGKQP